MYVPDKNDVFADCKVNVSECKTIEDLYDNVEWAISCTASSGYDFLEERNNEDNMDESLNRKIKRIVSESIRRNIRFPRYR